MDGRGVPLSLVVTGANRHDVTQLELVLDEIILERPEDIEQHLCADKGYDGEPALQVILSKRYIPHVKTRGEEIQEKATNPNKPPCSASLAPSQSILKSLTTGVLESRFQEGLER